MRPSGGGGFEKGLGSDGSGMGIGNAFVRWNGVWKCAVSLLHTATVGVVLRSLKRLAPVVKKMTTVCKKA